MRLPGRTSRPALAGGERAAVAPAHGVLTRCTVGVVDATAAVGPEREEVATAGSLLAGGDDGSAVHIAGQGKGAHCGASGDEKAFERHHDELRFGLYRTSLEKRVLFILTGVCGARSRTVSPPGCFDLIYPLHLSQTTSLTSLRSFDGLDFSCASGFAVPRLNWNLFRWILHQYSVG